MKKALVIYQSRQGRTKKYGEEISRFLAQHGIESHVISIDEFTENHMQQVTHLLLGCWTSGLFLFLQHPDGVWTKATKKMVIPDGVKIGLFTTYLLATGSMFNAMRRYIQAPKEKITFEWKSRTTALSESDKESLIRFLS
jgi:hypothetical protein